MGDIKYIPNDEFVKMTKKQKLDLPAYTPDADGVEITKIVLMPIRRKMYGYGAGAFFALTANGWLRFSDYDCWRITTDISNPVSIKYNLVRGDFEHGGVNMFEFANSDDVKVLAKYGGEILVTKK